MRSSLRDIGLLLSLSAAIVFCAPLSSKSSDNIWTRRDASIQHRTLLPSTINITMSPWPTHRYALPLGGNFKLVILTAKPYSKRPLPNVPRIKDFIRDFSDNLEHAYPPPALTPKEAGQSFYDTDSFTKWEITEWVFPISSIPAPSGVVVGALVQIAREVAKYGPPALVEATILGPHGTKTARAFNTMRLEIRPLGKGLVGHVVNATSNLASTS